MRLFVIFAFKVSVFMCRNLFNCSESTCDSNLIGDGNCNLNCNILPCNFDSANAWDKKALDRFSSSDCYWSCISTGCDLSLLGNNHCDSVCNSNECGFDLGDCGYCSSGCTSSLLNNSRCDPVCSNLNCMFDNDACGWCSEGCYLQNLTSSTCDQSCKTTSCLLQDSNPCISECAVGCKPRMLGNGICNDQCNNEQCAYDDGDCLCSTGCFPPLLLDPICYTTDLYKDPCDTLLCQYKNGACGTCAEGCLTDMLGNGLCNSQCNNQECHFDYGDCGCAFGCFSIYDKNLGTWTWDNNPDHFLSCLVSSCLYNYGSTSFVGNEFLVREIVLNQIISQNWSLVTLPNHPECLNSSLAEFDSGNYCDNTDPCNTPSGLYCVGMSGQAISNCLRSNGKTCIVCEGLMIMNLCVNSLTTCPAGYLDIPSLDLLFAAQGSFTWCLREPTPYSPINYQKIYVSPSDYPGNANGVGTQEDPFFSLYVAFTQVYAAYTQILLSAGVFHYEIIPMSQSKSLLLSDQDPLNINSFLEFDQLWLIGESVENRPVVYWHGLLKISPKAQNMVIKNVIFKGTQILTQNCVVTVNPDYCFYCPLLTTKNGTTIDQNSVIIDKSELVSIPQNCSLFGSHVLFTFTGAGVFENVDFEGFRQQFKTLVLAFGSLNFTNVTFNNLQPKAGGNVVEMSCNVNCDSVNFNYILGNVSSLNSGYQLTDFLELGSFFTASLINSIVFDSVSFTFNLLLSYLGSSNAAYLISVENQQGSVTICNSNFEANYVDSLIIVDVSTLVYNNLRPNYLGYSLSYSQIHFNITNSVITNIYSSTDLISYIMEKTVHNIYINNLTISNVAATGNGILYISNRGTLSTKDTEGISQYIQFNNSLKNVWIPFRQVTLNSLSISASSTQTYAILIEKMPWVSISHLTISQVSDSAFDSDSVIDIFSNNNFFLNSHQNPSQLLPLTCVQITYFAGLYNLYIDDSEIFNAGCEWNFGPSGISIVKISNNLVLTNIYIHDIMMDSILGLGISVSNSQNVSASNIMGSNLINTDGSIFEFYDTFDLNLYNITLINSTSCNLTPMLINQVVNLVLNQFEIVNCESWYSNSGCLYITGSRLGNVTGVISNGILDQCVASIGTGGALIIDSISPANSWNLTMTDLTISNSEAVDATALYVTSQCSFYPLATFNNFQIFNNKADLSVIKDSHSYGLIIFSNSAFFLNRAQVAAITGQYVQSSNFLSLVNVLVYNCNADLVFAFSSQDKNSLVQMTNVSVHDIVNKNSYGNVFSITQITFQATILNVFNIKDAVTTTKLASVSISNSKFFDLKGLFIDISNGVNFYCYFCEVFRVNGPLITASITSTVNLFNSFFYSNVITGQGTALLNIYSVAPNANIIKNCTFVNNTATIADLVRFITTSVSITSSKFVNNSSPNSQYTGFYLYQSNLTITSSVFSDQKAQSYGAFLLISQNSNVGINLCSFIRGSSPNGGAIYIENSELVINSSVFDSNTGANTGGSLSATNSPVTVRNSTFTKGNSLLGDAIFMDSGLLQIFSSRFSNSQSKSDFATSSVYLFGTCSLVVDSSAFVNSMDQVSALIVTGASSVKISNSQFMNIYSFETGATSFFGNNINGSVAITGTQFLNNECEGSGGAIYVEDMSFALKNSLVSKNNASEDGGGLYLKTPNCKKCLFSIESSQIDLNRAGHNGGAMVWYDYKPSIDNLTLFSNNTAAYGNNFASSAASLKYKAVRALSAFSNDFVFQDIAPGQNISKFLLISLTDTYGNTLVTDSSSVLTIQVISSYPDLSLTGLTRFTANQGVFNVTNFVASALPGSTQYFNASTDSISNSGASNDASTYENTAIIEINLRNCTYGEQISLTSCEPCPNLQYLIEPSYQCSKCPEGASCYGSIYLMPEPGYWRSSNYSAIVYACPASSACLGSLNMTDFQGTCANGYYSVKCAACLGGFTLTNKGACNACPSQVQNGFILALLGLLIVFVCVVLVKSSIKSAFKHESQHSIYIKIFTNYVQLVLITSQFNLQWPSYVLQIFNANKQVAEASDSIFSVDCYVASKNGGDPVNSYYYKLVLFSLLPFVVFFFSFLVWLIIASYKERYDYLKKELPLSMIIVFFLFYPNIVKFMFSDFACESIDLLGEYLMANYAIKCWNDSHTKYSLIVALPSILVWAIGLPTLVVAVMAKRKRHLNRSHNKIIFGFLYNGYRQERFFWEFLIMYRKMLMIIVAVFALQVSVNVQALIVVIVMVISVFLQYEFKPFNSSELNHMELEALITATLTLYCGLFYITGDIGDVTQLILFLLIAMGNAYFVVIWIYWMCVSVVDMVVSKFPVLKYTLKKGDAYEEEFYEEKLKHLGICDNKDYGTKVYTFMKPGENEEKEFKVKSVLSLFHKVLKQESKINISREESKSSDDEVENGLALNSINKEESFYTQANESIVYEIKPT